MATGSDIWLHDTRVDGLIAKAPGRKIIAIDGNTPVMDAANSILKASRATGPGSVLWILYHANYRGQSRAESEGGWPDGLLGGMGSLGKDGVRSGNVADFGMVLKEAKLESIKIISCGAASQWNGMEWKFAVDLRFILKHSSLRLRIPRSIRSTARSVIASKSDRGKVASSSSGQTDELKHGSLG